MSSGCARPGACARSASGREPQAEAEAEAEAEAPRSSRPRGCRSTRAACAHGRRWRRLLRFELRPRLAAAGASGRQLARLRRERQPDRSPAGRREQDGGRACRDQRVDARGDRRDRGQALLRAWRHRPGRDRACARRRRDRGPHRPGWVHDHPGARPQPLPHARADAAAESGRSVPRREARARLVEGQDPHGLSQRRLLRQSRLRDPGRGGDVLLRSGEPPLARAGGAPRRAATGAVLLRSAPQLVGSARAARPGPARTAANRGHLRHEVRGGGSRQEPAPAPEPGIRERRAVLRRLRRGPPAAGIRRGDRSGGRAEDLHDDPAAPAASRRACAVAGPPFTRRSGRRDRLRRPGHGCDPCDGGRHTRHAGQRVQPRDDG